LDNEEADICDRVPIEPGDALVTDELVPSRVCMGPGDDMDRVIVGDIDGDIAARLVG
jgi:hypothetical protein